MVLFKFSAHGLVHPPEAVRSFVETLIRRLTEDGLYYQGEDRRHEPRHVVALPVQVMPLDDHLHAAGQSFIATTRTISNSGISLFHSAKLDCPFLAVQLTDLDGKPFEAAVELLRCQSVGPYFELAGRFVTKVYDPLKQAAAPSAATT